jgi:hypothetical protein
MAKYNNIIGKRLLEVNEKPEQLTLIFEDGGYLIVYVKNGKLYIESSDMETNKHYLGLFTGMFLIIFGLIGSIYFLTNPEDFSEGYHIFMSRMFALLFLIGVFTFIFSIQPILDKYMKRRSLTSNKDNKL